MDSNARTSPEGEKASIRSGAECDECLQLFDAFVDDYGLVKLDTDGHVSAWSAGAERLFGYRADEIVGRPVEVLHTPENIRAKLPQRELSAAHNALHARIETEGWRVRRDGSRFIARSVLTALRDGADGPRGYAQIVHDISTRERLEERFRKVVEAAPNAIVEVDSDGRITMANVQAERMFGYTRAELLGKSVEILVPERFRRHHPEQRHEFARAPVSRPMGLGRDLYALRKDGSEFAVEIGLNPIDTEDGPRVLSAIVDISDRKNKEARIKAALIEKDALLGEIHHRVKNNLQIVHSLLDMQCARIEDQAVLEMLRDTQNRIQSMALIHQILYQSHDFSAVNFEVFLDDLVPSLASAYGLDSDRIAVHVEATDVPLPLSQAVPCGLIVNELVTNALKHAFPGGRRGKLEIVLDSDDSRHVRLTVRDDGVGITARWDSGDDHSHGLKLVRLLSEQLNGKLQVHSARPTEFVLRFPLRR